MITVIDFGSQTCHLICRRIREMGVESKIISYTDSLPGENLEGIIFSGSPSFVAKQDAPTVNKEIFELGVPILGICYGMQLMGKLLGGEVGPGKTKEYGQVEAVLKPSALFKDITGKQRVLMSHGDQVLKLPPGFVNLGKSKYALNIAMANEAKKLYAVQFHPEVIHTENGTKIVNNFIFNICKAKKSRNQNQWLKEQVQLIKVAVGNEKVICGLSGGVDSATAAALVYQAIGNNLRCVYVDTGLMREGETEQVEKDFKQFFGKSLVVIKAENQFLAKLKGVEDPEKKRKIIGELFIKIFEKEAQGSKWLVQGTIYPDIIESASKSDSAHLIKSHHNVGGLPQKMKLKLIEPVRDLYKDEVRQVAKKIGLPEEMINRQPFPGPGLAVRIRGEVTSERLARLRQAEKILQEEAKKYPMPKDLWVNQAIYVPLKTTGVKGDDRSFEDMIAIRSLTAVDAMTADWTRLPYDLLAKVSARIVGEVPGINRVVYDITTKPPATMEWE